jgi:hypothetical protein
MLTAMGGALTGFTLTHAGNLYPGSRWQVVTGVEEIPCRGLCDTRWLTGLWYTQAKVAGTVPKAVWH